MKDSIGTRLRFARESKGLSLSEVAAKVRVRETLLKLIENNEFEKVGAEVYVRGHIRSMATFLDLDVNELMSLYPNSDQDINEEPVDSPVNLLQVAQNETTNESDFSNQFTGSFFNPVEKVKAKSGANWSLLMAAALGVIAIVSVGTIIVSAINSPGTEVSAESVATPKPQVADRNESENLTAAAPLPGVDVLIQANGASSWVRATDLNDAELFEGIIKDGQEKRIGSTEGVKLLLGNAGALNLTVNGQVLGKAGGNGEVVRVEFGPEGPVQ